MKRKGFTYMEMIVTMLIIIALSLLSYPIYTGRKSNTKPALAEGYVLLGHVVNAQIAYYNEFGNFLAAYDAGITTQYGETFFTSLDTVLGINSINNRYFSVFNPYANGTGGGWQNRKPYQYHFTAIVKSENNGTIKLEYNLTERFEPIVSGI